MEMIEVTAFIAIVAHGGFTRAAEAIHLSQPAMSRRIELLEQELGTPLFERTHGRARLTDAGATFLPYAHQMLAASRDGAEAVAALEQEDVGAVTLALVGTLADTRLTARLARYRAAHPRVRLILTTGRSHEVSALVLDGDAHLGLRYDEDAHPNLVGVRVHEERMVVVASTQYEPRGAGPFSPQALAGLPWISFPRGKGSAEDPYTRLFARQLHGAGLDGAETIAIDSLTAQKRLIEAGFGIGSLPISSIEEEQRIGTLRILDVPALASAIPIVRIHRRTGYLSHAARALSAMLAEAW
jgi:DNA-binding transcriptional LysR family regulator